MSMLYDKTSLFPPEHVSKKLAGSGKEGRLPSAWSLDTVLVKLIMHIMNLNCIMILHVHNELQNDDVHAVA